MTLLNQLSRETQTRIMSDILEMGTSQSQGQSAMSMGPATRESLNIKNMNPFLLFVGPALGFPLKLVLN